MKERTHNPDGSINKGDFDRQLETAIYGGVDGELTMEQARQAVRICYIVLSGRYDVEIKDYEVRHKS